MVMRKTEWMVRKAVLLFVMAVLFLSVNSQTVQAQEKEQEVVMISMPGFMLAQWPAPYNAITVKEAELYAPPDETAQRLISLGADTPVSLWGITDTGWFLVQSENVLAYTKAENAILVPAGMEGMTSAQIQGMSSVAQAAAGVVFIGDSRMVQMNEDIPGNPCIWVAENGQGYDWFYEKGAPIADHYIGNGSKVLINFGVNDVRNIDKYIPFVNAKAAEWTARGAKVYYASVNPVWNYPRVTNEQIEAFNVKLQANLIPQVTWIDSYHYLMQSGFYLVDGVHYDDASNQKIYHFYLMNMQ